MKTAQESGLVRVVSVEGDRAFTGSTKIARPPQVGDVGAIVHVYSDTAFAVECVDFEGLTLWLADFHLAELAPVAAVGELFVQFFLELEAMIEAVGRADLLEHLRGAPITSRCNCGDADCAHFYTSPVPTRRDHTHENIMLPSQSGLIVLDVRQGKVVAVEVLDRPDVKRVLDSYLPVAEAEANKD